jgi:lipoprotein-anchoring transpeptidase ErfK/SrfK
MGDDNAADIPTTDQAFNAPTPTNTTTTDDTPATTSAESTEPEPQTPESPRPAPTNTVRADSPVAALVAEATGAMQDGRIIAAREILNRALHHQNALPDDRASIRESLADIAREVTFSPRVVPGDPMARRYTVQPGDSLSKIAAAEGVRTDWRFIQRINDIDRPTAIRVGQTLKLVQGPFHARIDKSDYRLDLFADERDADGNPIYLRSFPVGLGEYDSTPTGNWIVKNRELNPAWVNPRDPSERYARNDPDNPIGNHWIGLTGTDPDNREEWGIGIHGTAEPETIGTQASMGCVRMLEDHVSLCFETLTPERSRVVITD